MKLHMLFSTTNVFDFFAISVLWSNLEKNEFIDPEERAVAFSILSIENHWGCRGIRLLKVFTTDQEFDDFSDRALLGFGKHYEQLFVEVLFAKIVIG